MAGPLGSDAEGDQGVGAALDQFKALGDDPLKLGPGFDEMVGREDADHGLGILGGQHGRAQAHRVERIAAHRLAEELRALQAGKRRQDRLPMLLSGTDIAIPGGDHPFEPLEGDRQQALAAEERNQLLGQLGTAHGPQPRARPARDNQCITHEVESCRNSDFWISDCGLRKAENVPSS